MNTITEALTSSTRQRALAEINEQIAQLEARCPYRADIVPDDIVRATREYERQHAELRHRRSAILDD